MHVCKRKGVISSYQSILCPGGLLSSSFHVDDQENQGSRADLVAEAVARMQGIGALEVELIWLRDIGTAGTKTQAKESDRKMATEVSEGSAK